jgi:hypothetical protein
MDDFRNISIEDIEFKQIDVFGEYLPSQSTIEMVLKIFDSKKKKKIFRDFSDKFNSRSSTHCYKLPFDIFDEGSYLNWFKNLGDLKDISLLQANNIYLKMIKNKCKITGYEFELVVQSEHVMDWHNFILGNYGKGNKKEDRQMANICLKGSQDPRYERFHKFQQKEQSKHNFYHEYPDYAKALNYFISFMDNRYVHIKLDREQDIEKAIKMEAQHNIQYPIRRVFGKDTEQYIQQVFKQAIQQNSQRDLQQADAKLIGIARVASKILENHPGFKKQKQWFFCNRCKTILEVNPGKMPELCGDCQKVKKEEKKVERRIPRYGWVFDRIGVCLKCESDRIKIDEHETCFSCHKPESR